VTRALSDVRPVPRRGLSRDEAAMYIGISATKFDEMVIDGRMPAPVKIDTRKVWDIRSLDLAFDALSTQNPVRANSWDGSSCATSTSIVIGTARYADIFGGQDLAPSRCRAFQAQSSSWRPTKLHSLLRPLPLHHRGM